MLILKFRGKYCTKTDVNYVFIELSLDIILLIDTHINIDCAICRRAAEICKISAATAIDRSPLDPAAARKSLLDREDFLFSSRTKSGTNHLPKEQSWSLRSAAERSAESPAERLLRLSAEVSEFERDAEEAARQVCLVDIGSRSASCLSLIS